MEIRIWAFEERNFEYFQDDWFDKYWRKGETLEE